MDRRDSIKSLLVTSIAGGLLIEGCKPTENDAPIEQKPEKKAYGRTAKEKIRDEKLNAEIYFSDHEISTIAVLCDLILPAEGEMGSATDAGVPEFIEFMSKDLPKHQLPIRGGLMWIDNRSNHMFGLEFKALEADQQTAILDEIAYPDKADSEMSQGVEFFSLMRNLTLTGYYTSEVGIKDLGYKGNIPNVWDGVPQEVLDQYGLSYDEEWLKKCLDPATRNDIATWDADGNLIS